MDNINNFFFGEVFLVMTITKSLFIPNSHKLYQQQTQRMSMHKQ